MNYFPILIKLDKRRVLVCGSNDEAVFKIRILLKSSAEIFVFGSPASNKIKRWSEKKLIQYNNRLVEEKDCNNVAFAYVTLKKGTERNATLRVLTKKKILYCVVDDKLHSNFITPAIVDRNPVTVAIGSEGMAPALVRHIKAQIENILPQQTGLVARIIGAFRPYVYRLSESHTRRHFWARFFNEAKSQIFSQSGAQDLETTLKKKLHNLLKNKKNHEMSNYPVQFVSAGPGDPDLLTRKAANALHDGDIILYDRLIAPEILELCRREANLIEVGKSGFGSSWSQNDINTLLISKAITGQKVVRLKSGDAGIFSRLDEEITALDQAGLPFEVIPGVTTAAAAAASMGVSLTRRGRNGQVHLLTGYDINGFADYDWRSLALESTVAAIYMGVKAIPHLQNKLLRQGAAGDTPITVAENVGRKNAVWVASSLSTLMNDCRDHNITGPAILMLGLHPHIQRESLLSKKSQNSKNVFLYNDLSINRILPQLAVKNVKSASTTRKTL
jgi:uroporphyrin-III C-methyltransferase/precorrin-2 dehydrogenase/sirohydrochlorin ferrochelatase